MAVVYDLVRTIARSGKQQSDISGEKSLKMVKSGRALSRRGATPLITIPNGSVRGRSGRRQLFG